MTTTKFEEMKKSLEKRMNVHLQNSTKKDLKTTVKVWNLKSPVKLKWGLQTLAHLKVCQSLQKKYKNHYNGA